MKAIFPLTTDKSKAQTKEIIQCFYMMPPCIAMDRGGIMGAQLIQKLSYLLSFFFFFNSLQI